MWSNVTTITNLGFYDAIERGYHIYAQQVSEANKGEAGIKRRGLKGKGVKTVYFVPRAVPTEQHEISEDNFEV